MDGISSWFEYLSTRGDLVIETLAQTLTYVVLVTISASIVAIVLGVATRLFSPLVFPLLRPWLQVVASVTLLKAAWLDSRCQTHLKRSGPE
ncbi:MAG: hypothetical protein ACKVHY_02035 [Candidatus Nanopelagicales bacterium]